MTNEPGTAAASLAERYGAPRPGVRRTLVAGLGALGLLAAAWLVWTVWFHSNPAVASDLESFDIVGEHSVTGVVAVRTSGAEVVGRCTLRAFAEDHTIVGEASFEVAGARFVNGERVSQAVRTERRATALELLGCTSADQPRPR